MTPIEELEGLAKTFNETDRPKTAKALLVIINDINREMERDKLDAERLKFVLQWGCPVQSLFTRNWGHHTIKGLYQTDLEAIDAAIAAKKDGV